MIRSKGVKNVTFNVYPGVKHTITRRMLDLAREEMIRKFMDYIVCFINHFNVGKTCKKSLPFATDSALFCNSAHLCRKTDKVEFLSCISEYSIYKR